MRLWWAGSTTCTAPTVACMRPLAPLQTAPFSNSVARVGDLIAAGTPVGRLYASDKSRALYGVVAAPGVEPHTFDMRLAGARILLRRGAFISRRTAARLYRLPVDASDQTIDLGAVRPAKPPQRKEFKTHQVRPGALIGVPGAPLWLPHPADVWGLLAAVTSLEELVIAGDCIVSGPSRRERALASLDDLKCASERHAGGSGAALLRQALPLVRCGVESPAETRLRLLIVSAGLPEPQTSCPVATEARLFHADLGYPGLKIAIEYEGEYHFTGVDQARWDLRRYEAMQDAGWIVLRATALDLRDPRRFLARLADALRQRR